MIFVRTELLDSWFLLFKDVYSAARRTQIVDWGHQAHNLKVVGSNPTPATKIIK
jgi:hypothetical protein